MFGRIAIKKEIYACETALICVGLHIGELMPLGESSDTSHHIFNSVKYFFLVHGYALLLKIKSLTSMSSNSEILTRVSREGCILLEHHRETVASFLPTCSASHFPVLPFSTNAIFILFIFCDSIIHLLTEYNTLMLNAKLQIIFEVAIISVGKHSDILLPGQAISGNGTILLGAPLGETKFSMTSPLNHTKISRHITLLFARLANVLADDQMDDFLASFRGLTQNAS